MEFAMDFEWVAIALGDVVWISVAFALGILSRWVGLPPLVGFLATGFLLNWQGVVTGEMVEKLSDLGITLLLFTVGLKLNPRMLARPQVWAVTGLHASTIVVLFGLGLYGLGLVGLPLAADLDLKRSLLVAFALSFSSTVFAVKVLEERGEMTSLHGRVAIGILIMQDVVAVVFLALSTGKTPSEWAILLLLLFLLRPILYGLLERVGHGELLVLYGFLLALGGAKIFELVGLKGDLGALILGVLIANHVKSEEVAKTMLGFKDLFLLGFFLSVGLTGQPTTQHLIIGLLLTPFILLKSALFFGLLTGFRLRARSALLASLNLTNYSEFGLIVASIGVVNGWIPKGWMIILSIALSLSFVVAAVLNRLSHNLYARNPAGWRRFQRAERLDDDRLIDIGDVSIVVIGMGRVGASAYDSLRQDYGDRVVGIDIDPDTVAEQQAAGRNVLLGDPGDPDFWDRVKAGHSVDLVLMTVPKLRTSLSVIEQIRDARFGGRIAVAARYPDEVEALHEAGVDTAYNIYAEAGTGFANHVLAQQPDR